MSVPKFTKKTITKTNTKTVSRNVISMTAAIIKTRRRRSSPVIWGPNLLQGDHSKSNRALQRISVHFETATLMPYYCSWVKRSTMHQFMLHCVVYYTVCSKCVSIIVLEAFTQVQWFDRHWNERWYNATECVTAAHEYSPQRAVQYIAMQCTAVQCNPIQCSSNAI